MLKFSIVDMVQSLQPGVNSSANDTCAICLYSDQAKGATCAGLVNTGTTVVTWARFVDETTFRLTATDGTFSDPKGTDRSTEWYKMHASGDYTVPLTGAVGESWSVWRYQVELRTDPTRYDNDYRFSPDTSGVKGYIYTRIGETHTFYGGSEIVLENAYSGLSTPTIAIAAAGILQLLIF